MIFVPEIVLYKLLNSILSLIKRDYKEAVKKEDSYLYRILSGNFIDKFDYYEQAKELFLREVSHPRVIEIRQFFDISRATLPTIHLSLPGENTEFASIGMDQGFEDNIVTLDRRIYPTVNNPFATQYNIISTSENPMEVLLIYNVLKASMTSLMDSINLLGFKNVKIGGQDLQINSEIIPQHVYLRALTFSAYYEFTTPKFFPVEGEFLNIYFNGYPIESEDY